jgi:hypothetical protein
MSEVKRFTLPGTMARRESAAPANRWGCTPREASPTSKGCLIRTAAHHERRSSFEARG